MFKRNPVYKIASVSELEISLYEAEKELLTAREKIKRLEELNLAEQELRRYIEKKSSIYGRANKKDPSRSRDLYTSIFIKGKTTSR